MIARLVRLLGLSAVAALGACTEKSDEVELRLYPCTLSGGAPTSVELTIRNLDENLMEIGSPLAKTFPIDDPGVFSDGYATVGFKPPAGTVTADIAVTWSGGGDTAMVTYLEPVPALGGSMNLEASECTGSPGTTTTPTTDGTTGPGTTDSTTGSGSETGTTTNTTSTTNTTNTTSTTTNTTSTTGSTTDETTSTTSSTTDMTTDTTMGTTGGPMEGADCNGQVGALICNAAPGQLGTLLLCQGDPAVWVDKSDYCELSFCDGLGLTDPQLVGCIGDEVAWGCACADGMISECTMGQMSECGGMVGIGVQVDLCVEDGGNTWHYAAQCPDCTMENGLPKCIPQ